MRDEMIGTCHTQEFLPFGKSHLTHHPGNVSQKRRTAKQDQGFPIIKALSDISINENAEKETWKLRSSPSSNQYEEELYIKGCTVIWSKGDSETTKNVIKSYTVESPVLDAFWCSFVLPDSTIHESTEISMDTPGEVEECIAIVQCNTVDIYSTTGAEYIAALPFQVSKAWVVKNGLLFERKMSEGQAMDDQSLPVLFSLLHPHDEVAPVVCKTGGSSNAKVSYLNDQTTRIVFSSETPSLVMTYDSVLGTHSVWKVRRAKVEEGYVAIGVMDTLSSALPQNPITPGHSGAVSMSLSSHTHSKFTLSSQSPSSFSPLRVSLNRMASPGHSKSLSPSLSQLAVFSHSGSPLPPGSLFHTQSPSVSHTRSPAAGISRTPVTSKNMSTLNESYVEPSEPLLPEVCLEQLWSEPSYGSRDGRANKVFLCKDAIGQDYVNYLIPSKNQLRCVKFEESNDQAQLIFGTITVIPARDAAPLKNCYVILDLNFNLVIYTGVSKVSTVHVAGIPMSTLSTMSAHLRPYTPFGSPRLSGGLLTPRLSDIGMITSSRPASSMDIRFSDEVNLLSPVPTEMSDVSGMDETSEPNPAPGYLAMGGVTGGLIAAICHSVVVLPNKSYVILELASGTVIKTRTPNLTDSKVIMKCLSALKAVLPKEIAIRTFIKWYTMRNAIGRNPNQSEWPLFTKCILGLMGYDVTRLPIVQQSEGKQSTSPEFSSKKSKPSDQGSSEDWEYMLKSEHHRGFSLLNEPNSGLQPVVLPSCQGDIVTDGTVDTKALLFQYIPGLLYALHLVYEECKLQNISSEELQKFAALLLQLSQDLGLASFSELYYRDWPLLIDHMHMGSTSQIGEDHLKQMQQPPFFSSEVPDIHNWLLKFIRSPNVPPFPYLTDVCEWIKQCILLFVVVLDRDLPGEVMESRYLKPILASGHRASSTNTSLRKSLSTEARNGSCYERAVLLMSKLGMDGSKDLTHMPLGIALPLRDASCQCRPHPPLNWPLKAYSLIGREDLHKQLDLYNQSSVPVKRWLQESVSPKTKDNDGMGDIEDKLLKLRFKDDLRVQEVRRMLQSSKPVKIALTQKPEVSDHDFIEEQERHLYSICIRTLSLSCGRGMFTMRTYQPVDTETLPIPKLCLTGRAPPRNTAVELSRIDVPQNMNAWPSFHNGVAAGLMITDSSQVDSTWIVYNKPKNNELTNEHAGFLMALGLNGHLSNLATMNIYDYLCRGHEMTSVGLLLGIVAEKRGTMDVNVMRLLSIHIAAFLPPTSTELDMPHNVQVAAILGVGFLYQNTAHRHVAEVLLSEIDRPPGPEMENSVDRESYSLAAGLALGVVMMGKGTEPRGLSDLNIPDTLHHYMVGGHKKEMTPSQKERYKSPSYQIKEGDTINTNVTSPGATMALGMMFFRTKNSTVAQWLSLPDTQFLLEFVRPDFILLRVLSHGLVMWDDVCPTVPWVSSNIPDIVSVYAFQKTRFKDDPTCDVDFETMSQAFCNIVAGACMVIGLKFAGSANPMAFKTLKSYVNKFMDILSKPTLCEQAGKAMIESCLMVALLSLSMVMCGTGDLEVLRICRHLRTRVGNTHNYGYVLYGSHMFISMATGLLFLGGGRYSLSTSPDAVAAMLCAFFPKLPSHSNDNRYHLQAFRHLYVVATEARIVIPKESGSFSACYVPLRLTLKSDNLFGIKQMDLMAPCILPEVNCLQKVEVVSERYWPIEFQEGVNWEQLKCLLKHQGILYVKQRAGQLTYTEDPKGYRSLIAKSLTEDQSSHRNIKPEVIKSFTSDSRVLAFARNYCTSQSEQEYKLSALFSTALQYCVMNEKLEMLPTFVFLDQVSQNIEKGCSTLELWQVKLILAYCEYRAANTLINQELLIAVHSHIEAYLDKWKEENQESLRKYILGDRSSNQTLTNLLTWHGIPTSAIHLAESGELNFPEFCVNLKTAGLSAKAIQIIWDCLHLTTR